MNEPTKQLPATEPVGETAAEPEMTAEQTAEPKRYTLKSARTALQRMESELAKKTEQVDVLKKEIKELKPQIRSMTALVEQLEKEETEKKVHDALRMKSRRMTGNQVLAALDLVQQVGCDLGDMDIAELAELIRTKVSDKKKSQETEQPKVDTSINFSVQAGNPDTDESKC